ncbi:response regulator transcription factor [Paenibacillus sp. CMAA1364]
MMLKVMLVDDELLVRLGVKSLIDWEKHNFEFIGDAPDGEKALELMEQKVPDILLTDIMMPRMNGLELIEVVRQRYPNTLIIVLSSHNEFEYVRKAMKLGVEDYMLKTSLKPAELLELMIEVAGKITKGQSHGMSQPDRLELHETRQDAITQQLQINLQDVKEGNYLMHSEETIEVPPHSYLFVMRTRHHREGVSELTTTQLLKHLILSELEDYLASEPVAIDYREMVVLLEIEDDDDAKLTKIVENLIHVSNQLLGITLRSESYGAVNNWEEIRNMYAKVKENMGNRIIRESSRDDITTLIEYITKNFTQDISLRYASEMINMSESYLSTIFKKETGTGFIDWINLLRIDQAAKDLLETNLPSYIIAEQVGYQNINYFGRIFKKIKGVSPQKYRSIHQSESV